MVPRENEWVKVYGQLKFLKGNRFASIFQLRKIANFDEISFHFLNALNTHLYATRGPIVHFPFYLYYIILVQKSKDPQQVKASSVPPASFQNESAYYTPAQRAVLTILESVTAEEGIHVMSVVRSLHGQYTESDVKYITYIYDSLIIISLGRSAIAWLFNEGYLYNTIDSDHIRKC